MTHGLVPKGLAVRGGDRHLNRELHFSGLSTMGVWGGGAWRVASELVLGT